MATLKTLVAVVLLALPACTTGSANTIAGAATMTALAAGTSVANRAAGGCIALCTNGTVCNNKTGLCERMPCRGECGADQHCEENFVGYKCMPGGTGAGQADIVSQANGRKANIPVSDTANQPVGSGPPIVQPAAEANPPNDKSTTNK
jgi:hypothetical protein